jgi:hypothetical protein
MSKPGARQPSMLAAARLRMRKRSANGLGALKWFSEPGVRHGQPLTPAMRQRAFTAYADC